jgi:hypothetical protein
MEGNTLTSFIADAKCPPHAKQHGPGGLVNKYQRAGLHGKNQARNSGRLPYTDLKEAIKVTWEAYMYQVL